MSNSPKSKSKEDPRERSRTGAATDPDLAYWTSRLVNRKYVELARPLPFKELSVCIEHGGRSHFFPLGSPDPAVAAAKALKIHQCVLDHGWERALETYVREMTVAIFWIQSPLVATYTTLFSEPTSAASQAASPSADPQAIRVLLIEPDPTQRRSLVHTLNQTAGYRCDATAADIDGALKAAKAGPIDFVLVNRLLPDTAPDAARAVLQKALPDAPVFSFGLYASSDELFVGITGVANGYFLRRRAPLQLLEPLGAPRSGIRWSSAKALSAARAYFMKLLSAPPGEEVPDLPLTHREREMLEFLSRGFQDKEIAAALNISVWTVHTHMKSTFEKLGVHNRAEAVSRYLQK